MPRRTAVTTALILACAVATGPTAGASPPPEHGDRLTVTVTGSGRQGHDGTYRLSCHPVGGDHPAARDACARLDELTVWGRPSAFGPVPPGTACTALYGGPATAHIEGYWAGRPVSADFSRRDGCENARWTRLVPVLPSTASWPPA